jgi:hydrogenase/urease accessory protein HupE
VRRTWILLTGLIAVALPLILAGPATAHQVNTSYSALLVRADGTGRLMLSLDEADLLLVEPAADANGDGDLQPEEMLSGRDAAQAHLAERVRLSADGQQVDLRPGHPRVESDADGNLFLRMTFDVSVPPETVDLTYDLSRLLGPPLLDEHRNLLRVAIAGRPEGIAVLSADEAVHEIRLREPPVSLVRQVAHFVWLGMEHIWIGYDHILFLLALVVVGTRLGPLVKIVTAFTVAHSITLVLAALEWVALPSRVVESGIALSIAWVALENFWIKDLSRRWILTFCFGFVHGFGFANVLRDLGLPSQGLVASLLAFNVGVEIGQVAIVALIFPLILWLSRQSFHDRTVRIASGIILLFGVGWLVERVFDLSYMPL